MSSSHSVFWFRRDLRLQDNHGLWRALQGDQPVQCIFIFDTEILSKLDDPKDLRVQFIHERLLELKKQLRAHRGDLAVYHGTPQEVFRELIQKNQMTAVYTNHDYEPQATQRDEKIRQILEKKSIPFYTFKDQVIFEKDEVLSDQKKPYTVFTPYKKKWLHLLKPDHLKEFDSENLLKNILPTTEKAIPSLADLGFEKQDFEFPEAKIDAKTLKEYAENRDYPFLTKGTSHLGLHFRFGTGSIRKVVKAAQKYSEVWLSELIWREFFMQILWHHPRVVKGSFRPEYDDIAWRKAPSDFKKWCEGQTGYPLVDAGMRELNATGFMHNRVRMVTASFLCKHLLIYWLEGERYFAKKLLDYDLAANNGNWQWAAGTGCDAAPYFRIFNPEAQAEKFDPDMKYIKKWVPEFDTDDYVKPMVPHSFARGRALSEYGKVKGK